jgi:cyclopropane fatty-acyl-phospholipid synthase-like methyltransferase
MTQFLRLMYNLWYFRKPPWDTGISPPELLSFIDTHPPGRALDLGCGTGTNVITLARNGWQVTGVDFAPRAIALARKKAARTGISADLRVEDVTRLSLPGPYDLILDMGCFHSLSTEGRRSYLERLCHLLATGGAYMLYVFFRGEESTSGPGVTEADLQLLAEALTLDSRQEGSERGLRRSAWLSYHKSAP